MSPNLRVYIAETTGPIGIQMSGQALVAKAEPFGVSADLIGRALENLVVDGHERDGQPFGKVLIR